MRTVARATAIFVAAIIMAGTPLLGGVRPAYSAPPLVGTATTPNGMPLTSGEVALVDALGAFNTAMTNRSGDYTMKVSGMKAPFLIKAGSLFSYAQGPGVANVNVFTDSIVNMTYMSQGTSAATQFGAKSPLPITPWQQTLVSTLFKGQFSLSFQDFKLNPLKFDLFSTRFAANGKGFDGLLRQTQQFYSSNSVTLSFGLGQFTQSSGFTAVASPSGILVLTNAGGSKGEAVSSDYTMVPNTAAQALGLNGANTLLQSFQSIVNKKGAKLDFFDLMPVFDPNFLEDGKTATIKADFDATVFRAVRLSSIAPTRINSFTANAPDSSHNLIDIGYSLSKSESGIVRPFFEDQVFKCDFSGNCRWFGNQWAAGARVKTGWQLNSVNSGAPPAAGLVEADVDAPTLTVGGVKVSDADTVFFNNSTVPFLKTTTRSLFPTPKGPATPFVTDRFSAIVPALPPFPSYDNQFSFALNFSPSGSATYFRAAAGYTTESINLLQPSLSGGHAVGDAHLGKPLMIKWTPPQSFGLTGIRLEGFACNGTQSVPVKSNQKEIAPTSNSASITFPAKVLGKPAIGASFQLEFEGRFGQRSLLTYSFASCF